MTDAVVAATASANQRIYWGAMGGVYSANLDGSDQKQVVNTGNLAWSVDVDPQSKKLYWAITNPQRGIYRANLDGTQQEFIAPFDGIAERLTVDWIAGDIYWIDAYLDVVMRSKLDGSSPTVMFSPTIASQKGISLGGVRGFDADPQSGTLYISGSILSYATVWRTGRDFNSYDQMAAWFENGTISPKEVAVDSATGDIYWTDEISDAIYRTTAPGIHQKVVPVGVPWSVHGLTVDPANRTLYWTNQNLGTIYSANLDGSNLRQIASGYGSIQMIVVGPAIPEPTAGALASLATAALGFLVKRK